MTPSRDIARLVDIMKRLRDPETGCPWDIKQTFASIRPYTIEEAYEVADAIDRNDLDDLKDELGDLLLQVVFHARMAEEEQAFDFADVVEAITTKMVRRHPHVFANTTASDAGEVKRRWAEIKAQEKAERDERRSKAGKPPGDAQGFLGAVRSAQPALSEALGLQERAARVGFDWTDPADVLDKLSEEISELRLAFEQGDTSAIADEIGDLLFVAVNLARHAKLDPETALKGTNMKFRSRFGHIESALASAGTTLEKAGLKHMEALWQEAKEIQRHKGDAQ